MFKGSGGGRGKREEEEEKEGRGEERRPERRGAEGSGGESTVSFPAHQHSSSIMTNFRQNKMFRTVHKHFLNLL